MAVLTPAYWYYPPGQQVYPAGLKLFMHDAIRRALYWCSYPSILVEEDLNWTGVWSVYMTDKPEVPEGKIAVDGTPELIDGLWYQRWEIVDAPPPPDPEPEEPPAEPPVEPPVDPEPETPAEPPVDPEPDPAP